MNEAKTIDQWTAEIVAWAREKGWDEPLCEKLAIVAPVTHDASYVAPPEGVNAYMVLAKLMLVCTEISEAAECARDGQWLAVKTEAGKPEGFVTELADAMIRIMHVAGQLGLPLGTAIAEKMAYNATRPHRHGGRSA